MAKSKKEVVEEKPEFRPLVKENSLQPARQLFSGYEIEKRWVLLTKEEDHTKSKNGLELYDEVLQKGKRIEQGYIHDIQKAKEVLDALGIELDFKPNTIRLRKYGADFILTVKDRKETKKREVEWELNKKSFLQFWPLTKGARVYKTRLVKEVKGNKVEMDGFTDRFLLLAEIEVDDEAKMDKLPKLGMDVTGNKSWSNKALAK